MGFPEILGEANKPIYERVVNELIKIESPIDPIGTPQVNRGKSETNHMFKTGNKGQIKTSSAVSHFIRFINFAAGPEGNVSGSRFS